MVGNLRLVYVNDDQIAYEKLMDAHLARVARERLCLCCERPVTVNCGARVIDGRLILEHLDCQERSGDEADQEPPPTAA